MEEKKTERKLPDSILVDEEYRRCRTSWLALLSSAQRAYDYLLNDQDIRDILPPFKELTETQWIADFVKEKIDEVMKTPVPYDERMKTVGLWRKLESDVNARVKEIRKVYGIDPQAKVELQGCHITIGNLDELAKGRAMYVVPQHYKDYYEKIVKLADAVEDLNKYEKDNGLHVMDPNIALRFVEPSKFIDWRKTQERYERFKYTGCPRFK